jgi:hypothetical protein
MVVIMMVMIVRVMIMAMPSVTLSMASMIMAMSVAMMVVRGCGISAALGIERRFDRRQARAETDEQRFDRGIAPQPQPVRQDLHRHMAVAEMPGELGEVHEVAAAHLDQGLGLDHHLDEAAVFEFERVAHAQRDGRRQIEHALRPVRADQLAVLHPTAVGRKHHTVERK